MTFIRPYQSIAVLCFMFFIGGCETATKFILSKPDITITNVRFGKLTPSKQELIFTFNVHNRNPFSIPISGTAFSATLSGLDIINGKTAQNTALPAKSITSLELSINAQLLRSYQDFLSIVNTRKLNVNYEFSGKLITNAASFPIGIPFSKKGNLIDLFTR